MSSITTLVIDIGSSQIDAVIAQKSHNGSITILGSGIAKSTGITKGTITDNQLLGQSIKKAVMSANRTSEEDIYSATVSLSGIHTRTIRSTGLISIPNQSGLISETEIKKVLEMAYHNSSMVPEYEAIHIIPIEFKINDEISDSPINMRGSRLEVTVTIIIAKKSALVNINDALKPSGLDVENYILSGYASSISTLHHKAKTDGSLVLDIGSNAINMTLIQDNSLLYNSFLPFGSQHITNDISQTFNTPIIAAEMIKNQYATLVPFKEDDALLNKRIKAPMLGDETKSNEITLDSVQAVVHARVEEMLIMTYNTFIQSELESKVRAGIFLTGGLSKLPGLQALAQQVFNNFNVQIGIIKNIPNEYIDFHDNSKSTLAGLIFYALKVKDSYELDYKRQLRINKSIKIFDNNINHLDTSLEETSIEEIIDSLEQTLSQQDLKIQKKHHMVKKEYQKDDLVTRTLTNIKDWF